MGGMCALAQLGVWGGNALAHCNEAQAIGVLSGLLEQSLQCLEA
jgi:hypothetical protein